MLPRSNRRPGRSFCREQAALIQALMQVEAAHNVTWFKRATLTPEQVRAPPGLIRG